jgi:aryl-alcohol dehydrogenase-like predicted oxidoreductase
VHAAGWGAFAPATPRSSQGSLPRARRASLETSLRASGLEAFDVLQFHVWSDDWMGRGDWLETIEDLKKQGKIRYFGVSVNDYQPESALEVVRSGHLDTVQCIYNIFHQAPEEHLLPACAQHGVGVIARVPLDEGGLTGQITPETTFPAGDFRNQYFGGDRKAQVKRHVDALVADLGIETDLLAEIALRYVLSHDAVSTVPVGMRTVRNVERNVAVGDGRGLSAAQQAILAKHSWERNFWES